MKVVEIDRINNVRVEEDKESLKLYKNSKGYNWEIKILGLDVKKLVELNREMETQFGTTIV
jgi:hypothetical protein